MINIYIVHGQKHSQCPFNTAILYNLLRFSNAMVLFFCSNFKRERDGLDWMFDAFGNDSQNICV